MSEIFVILTVVALVYYTTKSLPEAQLSTVVSVGKERDLPMDMHFPPAPLMDRAEVRQVAACLRAAGIVLLNVGSFREENILFIARGERERVLFVSAITVNITCQELLTIRNQAKAVLS